MARTIRKRERLKEVPCYQGVTERTGERAGNPSIWIFSPDAPMQGQKKNSTAKGWWIVQLDNLNRGNEVNDAIPVIWEKAEDNRDGQKVLLVGFSEEREKEIYRKIREAVNLRNREGWHVQMEKRELCLTIWHSEPNLRRFKLEY